jgi:hypothetical protein
VLGDHDHLLLDEVRHALAFPDDGEDRPDREDLDAVADRLASGGSWSRDAAAHYVCWCADLGANPKLGERLLGFLSPDEEAKMAA